MRQIVVGQLFAARDGAAQRLALVALGMQCRAQAGCHWPTTTIQEAFGAPAQVFMAWQRRAVFAVGATMTRALTAAERESGKESDK